VGGDVDVDADAAAAVAGGGGGDDKTAEETLAEAHLAQQRQAMLMAAANIPAAPGATQLLWYYCDDFAPVAMTSAETAAALGRIRARLKLSPAVHDAVLLRFFGELCRDPDRMEVGGWAWRAVLGVLHGRRLPVAGMARSAGVLLFTCCSAGVPLLTVGVGADCWLFSAHRSTKTATTTRVHRSSLRTKMCTT
jgi:hypothetical protein